MKYFIPAIALMVTVCNVASAGSVDARLSTREAYVGMPLTLQLSISNATDYQLPPVPEIAGCDIRSAGAPAQSSQVTIVNGRRSESRSVTMHYLVTPRRAGAFSIPSLTVEVDGKSVKTEPLRFVATKSETGDLMFVEIEGGQQKVFVGEPLDLRLKIWLRPFRDSKRTLTLSERDMWNTLSDQTSWGGFSKAMQAMSENNQRPAGQEVLRDDGNGNERSYYLYEIGATVYPKRPGKIDADDVQIIVNYPTKLGKSRSPFAGMFGDDVFGGNSAISRMMNDDFFGASFGNRLAVSSTRPLVAEVSVDTTEVVPVPVDGRPSDYRGAVGRYRVVTQATPTVVDAGDPITLNIGIAGTGPMELVQAPPLTEMDSLTADFKVSDQSLAGFVKDDTKVFSTTIRPRLEGISEIPAIPFSFFDPQLEKYVTVMSDPIAITVHPAESMALDSIVGNRRALPGSSDGTRDGTAMPDLTNREDAKVLTSQTPPRRARWWWLFVILPPALWVTTLLTNQRNSISRWLPSFKSAKAKGIVGIERARDDESIVSALIQFVANQTGSLCSTTSSAIGSLRAAGLYDLASEVESFCQSRNKSQLNVRRDDATALLEKIEEAIAANDRDRVLLGRQNAPRSGLQFARRSASFLLVTASFFVSGAAQAADATPLSLAQQQVLLSEASDAYSNGLAMTASDSADAKELLEVAARKYQQLIDSGVRNSGLYVNAANSYLQTGELGRAIASYEHARQLDPNNRQLLANLAFANGKVEQQLTAMDATNKDGSWIASLRSANDALVSLVGVGSVTCMLAVGSLLFWGLLTLRLLGYQFSALKCTVVPLFLLVASLGSMVLTETNAAPTWNAIIVADNVSLYAGDGDQFDQVVTVGSSQGHRVEQLTRRGDWTQVRTSAGDVGWVDDRAIQSLRHQ